MTNLIRDLNAQYNFNKGMKVIKAYKKLVMWTESKKVLFCFNFL